MAHSRKPDVPTDEELEVMEAPDLRSLVRRLRAGDTAAVDADDAGDAREAISRMQHQIEFLAELLTHETQAKEKACAVAEGLIGTVHAIASRVRSAANDAILTSSASGAPSSKKGASTDRRSSSNSISSMSDARQRPPHHPTEAGSAAAPVTTAPPTATDYETSTAATTAASDGATESGSSAAVGLQGAEVGMSAITVSVGDARAAGESLLESVEVLIDRLHQTETYLLETKLAVADAANAAFAMETERVAAARRHTAEADSLRGQVSELTQRTHDLEDQLSHLADELEVRKPGDSIIDYA